LVLRWEPNGKVKNTDLDFFEFLKKEFDEAILDVKEE
jgi:hypothetical protein